MRVRRSEDSYGGHQYDLTGIPESTMMTIIEGVQKKLKFYENERHYNPDMRGKEDQEFLLSMILELLSFLRETNKWIVVTENGFELKDGRR